MRQFHPDTVPLQTHFHLTTLPAPPSNQPTPTHQSLSCYSFTLLYQQVSLLLKRVDYYESRFQKLQRILNKNSVRLAQIERLCRQTYLQSHQPHHFHRSDSLLRYINSEESVSSPSHDFNISKQSISLPTATKTQLQDKIAQYSRQIENISGKIMSVQELNLPTRLADIEGTIKVQTNVSKLLGEKVQSLNTKVNILFGEGRTEPLEFKKRKGSLNGRIHSKPVVF